MHALCGRLPALTYLNLYGVTSLTEDGLRAVGRGCIRVKRCSYQTRPLSLEATVLYLSPPPPNRLRTLFTAPSTAESLMSSLAGICESQ